MSTGEEKQSEKSFASVREMARKFEGLADEVSKKDTTKDERRELAYQRRPKKPVKSQPQQRESAGSSSSSSIIRTDDEHEYDDDDDDLLFDKLITDINIVCRHSATSLLLSEYTSTENEDLYSNEHIYDEVAYHASSEPSSTSPIDSNHQQQPGQRVIDELLERERSYLLNLTNGITNYMMAPDAPDRPIEAERAHIFSNIAVIRNFHQNTFLPGLERSAHDVERLCNCICEYIELGYFYSYIEYAINRKRAKMLCDQHRMYFRRRAAEVDDPLGIEAAFLLQPIQRLPRYRLLLYQLIQQLGVRLSNDEHGNIKAKIAACCRAEKHIQRLLDRMNDSMIISDIIEFQTHLEFLLRNIADHGEFQMVADFLINDQSRRRRYAGKLFLFERCVVYTEAEDLRTLRFRGFFQQANIGMAFLKKRIGFTLFHLRPGNEEIECEVTPPSLSGSDATSVDGTAAVFTRWSGAIANMMLRSAGTVTWNPGRLSQR